MSYFTEDLLTSAKYTEFFPISDSTFSDDVLIRYANEEMLSKLVPFIMSNRQDFFLQHSVTDLTQNLNHYAVPSRAIGNVLKDLFYVPDSSNTTIKYPIPKIEVHDVQRWASIGVAPSAFHMQSDEVILYPIPSASQGQLMFYYFRRPSQIVPTTSCAKITAVSSLSGTTTFTVDTDLTASLSVGSTVDLLSSHSPFIPWADDVAITAITSTTIAMTTTSVSNEVSTVLPAVGDYIAAAGTCNIPQVSIELQNTLSEMICYRVLKAQARTEQMQRCAQNITDNLKMMFKVMENRVESEVDTLFEQNSILNAVSYSGYRFVTR